MKMVKSLLLGTAAGLLAVAGAQAADMPVKAKPVEYVKICSLYGAGFYYIPGTDTCLKIGGYVRVQTEYNGGSSGQAVRRAVGVARSATLHARRHQRHQLHQPRRRHASMCATRPNTAPCGRYIRAGWNQSRRACRCGTTPVTTGGEQLRPTGIARSFSSRASRSVAAQSFFDLFTYGGAYTYLNVRTSGDTGAAGATSGPTRCSSATACHVTRCRWKIRSAMARSGTCDDTAACFGPSTPALASDNGLVGQSGNNNGFRVPDIITNLRIDQAWGYLGRQHGDPRRQRRLLPDGQQRQQRSSGGQVRLGDRGRRPAQSGRRRHRRCQLRLGRRVLPVTPSTRPTWQIYNNANSVGVGWTQDGIFDYRHRHRADQGLEHQRGLPAHLGTGGDLGWQVADDGVWRLRQRLDYNDKATNIINSHLPGAAGTRPCGVPVAVRCGRRSTSRVGSGNSCSPDWSFYQVGSRTQFNPAPLMDIGLDVVYTQLNSRVQGTVLVRPLSGRTLHGRRSDVIDDQSVLTRDRPLAAQLLPMIA